MFNDNVNAKETWSTKCNTFTEQVAIRGDNEA